jgi:hypothetical protein
VTPWQQVCLAVGINLVIVIGVAIAIIRKGRALRHRTTPTSSARKD